MALVLQGEDQIAVCRDQVAGLVQPVFQMISCGGISQVRHGLKLFLLSLDKGFDVDQHDIVGRFVLDNTFNGRMSPGRQGQDGVIGHRHDLPDRIDDDAVADIFRRQHQDTGLFSGFNVIIARQKQARGIENRDGTAPQIEGALDGVLLKHVVDVAQKGDLLGLLDPHPVLLSHAVEHDEPRVGPDPFRRYPAWGIGFGDLGMLASTREDTIEIEDFESSSIAIQLDEARYHAILAAQRRVDRLEALWSELEDILDVVEEQSATQIEQPDYGYLGILAIGRRRQGQTFFHVDHRYRFVPQLHDAFDVVGTGGQRQDGPSDSGGLQYLLGIDGQFERLLVTKQERGEALHIVLMGLHAALPW
ncbi:MAG: hypothetical protein P8010_18945 [Desulfosarcinaceae bacterium]